MRSGAMREQLPLLQQLPPAHQSLPLPSSFHVLDAGLCRRPATTHHQHPIIHPNDRRLRRGNYHGSIGHFRLSSNATGQGDVRNTAAASPIPTTINSGARRTTVPVIPLHSDQHQPLATMADTSTRHRTLEIGQRSSPPKPTAWHETVHRDQLVRIYDTVAEVTARNPKYPKCTTSQVGSTLNAMLKRCPELAQGKIPLTRDWIEYVLGKALRSPFCTAAMMGRWEILASSGGARGMWGPW